MNAYLDSFNQHRPKLMAIAYRMLGSRSDAEDVLQDAYIRWLRPHPSDLRSHEAWLVTVVTRLCIDRLRTAKKERENYVGQWIPEPWVSEYIPSAEQSIEVAGDISIAFLMVLERLAAEERAVFLLREVFDFEYKEIAQMLGKSQSACRQIMHRAKQRVRQNRPRFEVSREAHVFLLEKFIQAAQSGKRDQLMVLFADDISLTSDGGGKVLSVFGVLHGSDRVARLYHVIRRNFLDSMTFRMAEINGAPGLLRYVDGNLDAITAIVTDGIHILDIYVVRNPNKLRTIL